MLNSHQTTRSANEVDGFNPLKDLFAAQSSKPDTLRDVNLRALSPFQRALLVIDGTVTKFIEAYTMQPVEIIRLHQRIQNLPVDHIWLEAQRGVAVVAREVLLRGKYNQRLYAYAASLVIPDRLGEAENEKLEIEGEGLGRILNQNRLETYRDILWYGKEDLSSLPLAIGNLVGQAFLSRTYRIIARGKPIMFINEKFPLDQDWIPSLD
jgi:chorismate-pyruvate lyase